ncbi:sugar phosphate nucleotidyltransferase [Bacteroidota bacterium]
MQAIIPVAGFGKRLKPHTFSTPKVLLNVGGKPIIAHIIDKLIEEKINKATFVIGYLGEKIIQYVNESYPELEASFVEQKELLGLGHAIFEAMPTINDKEVFIVLGDTVFDVDLKNVFDSNNSSLGVKLVDDPRRFGVAVTKDDKVVELIEKPKTPVSKLALVGLYYIKNAELLSTCLKELIDKNIRKNDEYQLTDALQIMIQKGEKFTTFPVEGWYDCGKPETLLSTNRFLLTKFSSEYAKDNVIINPPVFIAESAKLNNCVVGPNTTIADNCVVEDSIIKNSIINSNAVIERSVMENSIIGSNGVVRGNFNQFNIGDSAEINF